MTPYEVIGTVEEIIGDPEMKMRERCWNLCRWKLGSCLQNGYNPEACETFKNGRM